MGIFGNSFKRELGKNTAKVVSNFLFGDKFATPYRIIRKQQEERKKIRNEAKEYKEFERELERKNRENDRECKRLEKKIAEFEKEKQIEINRSIVEKHNSYLQVIQSIHKDYYDEVNWSLILKKDPPKEIKSSLFYEDRIKEEVEKEVENKLTELKKKSKFSILHFITKRINTFKYKWILKIIGDKYFTLVSIWATLIFLMLFYEKKQNLFFSNQLFFLYLTLIYIFLAITVFSLITRLALIDYEKEMKYKKDFKEIESLREKWLNEYMDEQDKLYNQYIDDKKYYEELILVANNILNGKNDVFIEALRLINPFEDIENYGSELNFKIVNEQLVTEFLVKGNDVIPSTTKRLIRNGLEIKDDPIPNTKYQEIFQDYVCSCILRIAKEVFSILPISKVLINAKENMLDTSTGKYDYQTIVSVFIEKSKLSSLDFNFIDPSDSISNFSQYNMEFNKGTGFYPVSELIISNNSISTIMLKPLIEDSLVNIWRKVKYQNLLKNNYMYPSFVEKEAILFIGLNPSYNEDDKNIISYNLKQRGNYGQFYKKYEEISEYCNFKWTYIDLLFFRETKQDKVDEILKLPNNVGIEFIWEQLMISKEILKICDPKVIVVCNSLAAKFLGKNRKGKSEVWIGLNFEPDEKIGAFKWNTIPVVFTRPLSGLGAIDNNSYEQLKFLLKNIINNPLCI